MLNFLVNSLRKKVSVRRINRYKKFIFRQIVINTNTPFQTLFYEVK